MNAAPTEQPVNTQEAALAAIVADVGRAFLSIEQVDALVSTAAAAIASGDFHEPDIVRVLQDFAWPQIEEVRQAIERIQERVGVSS